MADAIVSVVEERLTAVTEEQIRHEVNLVRVVEEEVQSLRNELKTIRNVLNDAESRRYKDKHINDWLVRLEEACHEMEDVLDEWDYAILKFQMEHDQPTADVSLKHKVYSSSTSSCLCFKKVTVGHDIANKIKNVKKQLDHIFKDKDRYGFVISQPTTDPSPESRQLQFGYIMDDVYGRHKEMDILLTKIMYSGEEFGPQVLSIVGVGGLGKTTLAHLVYNQVEESFDLRIWVCVSDPFDEVEIAKRIIESVNKGSSPNTNQLDVLFNHLIECISGKKFFLVLDDVWIDKNDKWEPLKNCLKHGRSGSTILVTTRKTNTAKVMGTLHNGIYHLDPLSAEECYEISMGRRAWFESGIGEPELRCIMREISKMTRGLPLAAGVLGSVLQFKNTLEEFEEVLESEIWDIEEAAVDIFPHLLLSYNELSPTLKRCFSYCAAFPKDYLIDVENLITNWIAQGYLSSHTRSDGDMELKGREYFDILARRSLFKDFEIGHLDRQIRRCNMHDIVHDFAEFLRKRSDGRLDQVDKLKTTCQSCSLLLVSHVRKYRSLFCRDNEPPPKLCDCLKSLRALRIRWPSSNMPREIENLIHLRWLDLSGNKFSRKDTKIIFKLYNLLFLWLRSCCLEEISREIGNLKHLRLLDLSDNYLLKKLPNSICNLHELRSLNVDRCSKLCVLPDGIHRLINLKHLHNQGSLKQCAEGVAQLTGLSTLPEFNGGSGFGRLGWLKNLNHLRGSLKLSIKLAGDLEDLVKDAREAELRNKTNIEELQLFLMDETDEKQSSMKMDLIGALEPHPCLRNLEIHFYMGSKLPSWITSPLNELRCIAFYGFKHMSPLPPLGKLPCLEKISIVDFPELQFVGRDFLGIAPTKTAAAAGDMDITEASSSSLSVSVATNALAFPELKELTFSECPKWKEWEDITAEEEDSYTLSLMPCLRELHIRDCAALTALPHRLLRKASRWLGMVNICGSTQLLERYSDKDGSAWKSISQDPYLQIKLSFP